MSRITTHILDIAQGKPARGVPVSLDKLHGAQWTAVGAGVTDDDGRQKTLTDEVGVVAGTYRLTFNTGAYFQATGVEAFYPEASVVFVVKDPTQHFHVPLLLSPFGYSTYRGS